MNLIENVGEHDLNFVRYLSERISFCYFSWCINSYYTRSS